VAIMFVAIGLPFALGGELEPAPYVLPFIGATLVIAAFVRREGLLWPIVGLLLTAIYVGLHLIATA